MDNISNLLTGNGAVDYINITTIIVNSIVLFGSAVLFIFFVLNIILKIVYHRIEKTICIKYNEDFLKFPNGQSITLNQLYTSQKLDESKKIIDNEFNDFYKELKEGEKKLLIFKKILQILKTLILFEFRYRKFSKIINDMRILYIIFSTNKYNQNNFCLYFEGFEFKIDIIDSKYFKITLYDDLKDNFSFDIRLRHNRFEFDDHKHLNVNYDKNALKFINSFLMYISSNLKKVKKYMKKDVYLFNINSWIVNSSSTTENYKSFITNKYKKLIKKYYVVKVKNDIFKI